MLSKLIALCLAAGIPGSAADALWWNTSPERRFPALARSGDLPMLDEAADFQGEFIERDEAMEAGVRNIKARPVPKPQPKPRPAPKPQPKPKPVPKPTPKPSPITPVYPANPSTPGNPPSTRPS